MKPVRIVSVAALALAALGLAGAGGPAAAHGAAAAAGGITVTGSGTVSTVPDRAGFSFGVVTQAKTASAALAANSAAAARVIAALKDAGVAAADIQTEQVSLSPRTTSDGETIVGYTASNSVSAAIRNLDRAGAVIDAAVAAGADQVSGPSLTRSDRGQLYRDALKAAVADARAKAQAIAGAGGLTLGRITAVVEGGAPVLEPQRGAVSPATPVPIEPGTQQVQADVTVTFATS